MHLGTSPRHARSVALVLSLVTGYVLPQFHLKFDDSFETVQDAKSIPLSKWQVLSRFITTKDKHSQTMRQAYVLQFQTSFTTRRLSFRI
jgi:hypothetical protein